MGDDAALGICSKMGHDLQKLSAGSCRSIDRSWDLSQIRWNQPQADARTRDVRFKLYSCTIGTGFDMDMIDSSFKASSR